MIKLKPEVFSKQYCFKTKKTFQALKFIDKEELNDPPEISEKQFHNQLAEVTSDLIARRLNIYPKQALNLFFQSRVYQDLMASEDEFDQMMPADLFDLRQNK